MAIQQDPFRPLRALSLLAWIVYICLASPSATAQNVVESTRHSFSSELTQTYLSWPQQKAQIILDAACRELRVHLKPTRPLRPQLVLEVATIDEVVGDENNPTHTIVRLSQWDERRFAVAAVIACRNALLNLDEVVTIAERAMRVAARSVISVKELQPSKRSR
ncbi:MAG: hypothetical protein AB7O65_00750 [Candidatus Korobacteraceae bacterium]